MEFRHTIVVCELVKSLTLLRR